MRRFSTCSAPDTGAPCPALSRRIASCLSLVGCAHHVLHGDTPLGARALNLGEVDPQLLGLLLGCLRGVRLFLPASPGGVLSLLGSLPGGVLSLLSGASGCVLS